EKPWLSYSYAATILRLAFSAGIGRSRGSIFRTRHRGRLPVRVQRRHRRDAELLRYCPPRQPLFIREPHNFIPAKYTLRSADDLPGSLSGPDCIFGTAYTGTRKKGPALCSFERRCVDRVVRGIWAHFTAHASSYCLSRTRI